MRKARVYFQKNPAGHLTEVDRGKYVFEYDADYAGLPISWTMPVARKKFEFSSFPPFFDGLLPEGPQLEALLRLAKLDRHDELGQLIHVGKDMVGAVTVEAADGNDSKVTS